MNFFKRIGAVKHKFKVQFIIDKLTMKLALTERLSIVVKRGSKWVQPGDHKKETQLLVLEKGVANFGKEILTFDPVTMFYETDSKSYLEKEVNVEVTQGQIRLVIHTQEGDKKLGGVIKFDLSTYANDKCEYKRQEKEFQKCPDKAKNSKLRYEVYMKFLRESNSETGSQFGALTKKQKVGKQKEKDKAKLNQTQQTPSKKTEEDVPSKAKLKALVKDTDEAPKDQKKSKNKTEVQPAKVYFDKEHNETELNDPLDDRYSDEEQIEEKKPSKPKKQQKNGVKVIGHKKLPEEPAKPAPSKKKPKEDDGNDSSSPRGSLQEEEIKPKRTKTSKQAPLELKEDFVAGDTNPEKLKLKESKPDGKSKKVQVPKPFDFTVPQPPVDPYSKILRPTERTEKATYEYLQERISSLEKQNAQLLGQKESLGLKVTKLTQNLGAKEKELKELKVTLEEKNSSSPTLQVASKKGDAIKELQLKLAEAQKQRGMELLQHQVIRNKYDELKAKLEEERNRNHQQLTNLDEEQKQTLKSLKDDFSEARLRLEKMQKQKKEYDKQRLAYRKEIEIKNSQKRTLEERLKQMTDELTRQKMLISEAMNSAAEMQDERLTSFMETHFI